MAHVLGLYGWLVAKFLFVFILTGYHVNLAKYLKDFANGRNEKKTRFFRIINEVPTLLLSGIIFTVVFKPI